MKIGTLAKRTGLNASAIRYYEKMGLLAAPHRTGGQRHYSEETVPRVLLIRFTSEMGFTLGEIKLFLSGLRDDQPIGPRWRRFAKGKIVEVDRTIERSVRLKTLFQNLLKCRCASLKVCVGCLCLNEDLNPKATRRQRRRARSEVLPRQAEACPTVENEQKAKSQHRT